MKLARGLLVLGLLAMGCSKAASPPPVSVESERGAVLGERTKTARPASPPRAATSEDVQRALQNAYRTTQRESGGKNADYIPALAAVDARLFGIALATVDGAVYEIGNAREAFSIQSVSKVFTLARAIELLGAKQVERAIGVNATGKAFNSIIAIEENKADERAIPGNPLVNPGAIATVALLPATTPDERWSQILANLSAFAGRPLSVNQEVYKSESETNTRNRAIGLLLHAYTVIESNPDDVVDIYTRQCSVNVTARDLAVMGATLANGGTNPVTEQKVVEPTTAAHVLAVMTTAGLYETTGAWMYEVGAPAKSGVGGGIVAVVPGKFAIGTFSPPLDDAGNSVRGQLAIAKVVSELHANPLASQPQGTGEKAATP